MISDHWMFFEQFINYSKIYTVLFCKYINLFPTICKEKKKLYRLSFVVLLFYNLPFSNNRKFLD